MTIVLSLIFFGIGVVLIVSSAAAPSYRGQGFPRYGGPSSGSLRIWPVIFGALSLIAGVALFLVDKAD